jgi:hypothetical protein
MAAKPETALPSVNMVGSMAIFFTIIFLRVAASQECYREARLKITQRSDVHQRIRERFE